MKRIVATGIVLLRFAPLLRRIVSPGALPTTAGATACADAARLPGRDLTAAQ